MGGLQPVLEHLEVGALWVPRPPEPGEAAYLALWRTAFQRGVPIRMPPDRPGRDIDLLHPIGGFSGTTRRRVNDESLVLRFSHGDRSLLFTGDIEGQAEAWLSPLLAPADVVKVPHHGSRSSSSMALAAALRPSVAVFSCGPESRFGHPHPEALSAWR
jgi:competence protein ComEC